MVSGGQASSSDAVSGSPERIALSRRWHCQLVALGSCWSAIGVAYLQLRRSGDAADLGPNLEGLDPGGSILDGWNSVAAELEEVVDPIMGGEEALGLAG